MREFKSGDKVRVVNSQMSSYWYHRYIGRVFTLERRHDHCRWHVVEELDGLLEEEDFILEGNKEETCPIKVKIKSKIDELKYQQSLLTTNSEKAHAAWNLELASYCRQKAYNCKDMISVLESLLVD